MKLGVFPLDLGCVGGIRPFGPSFQAKRKLAMEAVMNRCVGRRRGFTLLELVIVIVVLAIIAAIAIPRLGQAGQGASTSALKANLQTLRYAIDMYAAEHGSVFPAVATFEDQMTMYTDASGGTSATKTGDFVLGPYLQQVPPLPVGSEKGSTGVAAAAAAGIGWEYDEDTGSINAALPASETDDDGKAWNEY